LAGEEIEMSEPVDVDEMHAALVAEARRRFGDQRAAALADAIAALAADLARVLAAPLPREVEPGFYLREEKTR
jgi:hypothetical protein